MGLKTVLQDLMPKVLTALGDIPLTITYYKTGTYAYNASTGVVAETSGTSLSCTAIMSDYQSNEIDHQTILDTDKKIMIPRATLGISYDVSLLDRIAIGGVTYHIVNKRIDPAEAMWVLQCRV